MERVIFCSKIWVTLFGLFAATACVSESVRRDGLPDERSFEVYASSSVASDPDNRLAISSSIGVLGDYKYSLDGSLAKSNLRGIELDKKNKVVKDKRTGKIGITQGRLIVKYVDGLNGENIALDYGLNLVDQLPSINRLVVQLSDLTNLEQIQETLSLDRRVLTTSLEVYYGGYQER